MYDQGPRLDYKAKSGFHSCLRCPDFIIWPGPHTSQETVCCVISCHPEQSILLRQCMKTQLLVSVDSIIKHALLGSFSA